MSNNTFDDTAGAMLIVLVSIAGAPFTGGLSLLGILAAPLGVRKKEKPMSNLPVVRNLSEVRNRDPFDPLWTRPASYIDRSTMYPSLYGTTPESPETALARLQPALAMKLLENEGKRRLHASAVSSLSQTAREMADRSGCDVEIETVEIYGFFGGVRGHRTTVRKG